MKAIAIALLILGGCIGDDATPPDDTTTPILDVSPEVTLGNGTDVTLLSCESYGCVGPLFCNSAGVCVCTPPDTDEPVECQR